MTQADQTLDESALTHGTQSPYLPGTKIQYAWDSTSLGMLKTCPRLYQYTMIDGWAVKDESVHLRFGIEYHQALQEYDMFRSSGFDHPTAMHSAVKTLLLRTPDFAPDETIRAGKYKNRKSLVGLVIDYLDHFENDTCETYIKADGSPAVELSFRFELGFGPEPTYKCKNCEATSDGKAVNDPTCGEPCNFVMHPDDGIPQFQPYILSGHIDRVVSFNDQLMVMDHKTTITTPSQYYFAQYEPNNQMTLYTLAGQIILGTPIKGVCISAAQLMIEKPNNFVRGFTYRTHDQLQEWIEDLQMWLMIAESYAKADYWPMNDTACDKFGGCKFRGICSKSPDVREMFLKSDFNKLSEDERWNPLRSR